MSISGIINRVRQKTRKFRCRRFSKISKLATLHENSVLTSETQPPYSIIIGEHSHIRGHLGCFGGRGTITVGDYCYIGDGSRVWAWGNLKIGSRVLISHGVTIMDSDTHPIHPERRAHHFKEIISTGHISTTDLKPVGVEICDDAWIGCGSVILKGVRIGLGAVVGAGSIVRHDIPDLTVWAGNPARFIRKINLHN